VKVDNYKDLLAYQKSYKLALLVYDITAKFPDAERYGLVSQLRRAAVSVPSNIAEGYRRGSKKEYNQFLKVSLGSNAELETQLSLSKDLGYIDEATFKQVYDMNEEVGRLLANYITRIASGDK
jgi:four helix bundle protein